MSDESTNKTDAKKATCACGSNENFAHKEGDRDQVRSFASQDKVLREFTPIAEESKNSTTSECCSTKEEQKSSPCACSTTTKETEITSTCGCSSTAKEERIPSKPFNNKEYLIKLSIGFVLWLIAYNAIIPFANLVTYSILGLASGSPLGASIHFFIYDTIKILLLLVFMVYLLAMLRASLNTEKVRSYLAGKTRGVGYLIASAFGAITPFCSCSSIPLFIGFTNSRIPLGITMSFLITSPLINEVAVILLWGLLGWKFTITYVIVGLISGIIGGFIIDTLKAERYLQPFLQKPALTPLNFSGKTLEKKITLEERHRFAYDETYGIVTKIWKWVFIGVGIGAYLHGYIPQEWFEQNLNSGDWWSVPVAVIAGIPLYTNVTGIIPIMESLLLKGLPVGTTLAFCMSAVGASLPEILMLKQVMQWKLLAIFIGILLVLFVTIGWIFNAIHGLLL